MINQATHSLCRESLIILFKQLEVKTVFLVEVIKYSQGS
jgi:hypothetical protein